MLKIKRLLIISLALLLGGVLFFQKFIYPKITKSALNLTSASATLSNSRLSYRAGVASGSSGSSIVTIDATGNPDNTTNHLFPGDTLCFTDVLINGCIGSTTYTVPSIISSTSFNVSPALANALLADGYADASQSGSLTIAFTTTSQIPLDGDILITIPMADNAKGNDGLPDAAASVATGGFDLNVIAAGDISTTGCTDANWTATETITVGATTVDHTIRVDRVTTACAASSAVTVTIDTAPGIVNPSPKTTGHTQGVADVYTINVKTRDGSDNTLDQVDILVAPVEAVLVSATVDEILYFSVTGITADSGTTGTCGITRTASTPDSTAYSVPWGTLPLTYAAATNNTSQLLEVDTNAASGYAVTVIANDQMGKNGVTCTGDAGASVNCIPDTACGATPCTHETLRDWGADPSSYPGLGYSLEEVTAGAAVFEYDDTAAAFNAKQFADAEGSQTAQTIMSRSVPVEDSQVYVCFRTDISSLQPAGYYYNKVKYTATATF